jgi:hypothetical protein
MLTMSARALATAASLGGRLMVNMLHGGEGEKYFENTECECHHHIDHGTNLEAQVYGRSQKEQFEPLQRNVCWPDLSISSDLL